VYLRQVVNILDQVRPHFHNGDDEATWHAGNFLNEIKEKKITTEALIDEMARSVDTMVQNVLGGIHQRILNNANQAGLNQEVLNAYFEQQQFFQPRSIFEGIQTTAQRTGFIRRELGAEV